MDLIIKPTQRCNFKCSFCSSNDIAASNHPSNDLDLKKIKRFLERFPQTRSVIVNGGDPLMVAPDFYFSILDHINTHGLPTKLHLCTNLWDWWLHPKKWECLFSHEKISVGTSFDFGGRLISEGRELDVELFIEMCAKFKECFGYTPSFVSVISDANKHRAMDLVALAKYLGVECKLNPLLSSGRSGAVFTTGDMYNIYLDVAQEQMEAHEFNTKQMLKSLKGFGHENICPQNRKCDEGIRNLQPLAKGYEYGSCGAFGDDQLYGIDFDSEMKGEVQRPLQSASELQFLKEECLSCPNFNICNGCYKTVNDLKKLGKVEESCAKMKRFRERAQALGFA